MTLANVEATIPRFRLDFCRHFTIMRRLEGEGEGSMNSLRHFPHVGDHPRYLARASSMSNASTLMELMFSSATNDTNTSVAQQ